MNTSKHPSRLTLDLLLIGSAPPEAEVHVRGCPRCSEWMAVLARERDTFLEDAPRPPVPLPPSASRSWPARRGRWIAGLALAASVAALLLLSPRAFERTVRERAKGGTFVELYVRDGAGESRFAGSPLDAGDTLLFRYTTERTYVLVIDVEASGKIAPMIAGEDGTSLPIERGSQRTLPVGVRLDDYSGEERIIAVFSDRPLAVSSVVERTSARFRTLEREGRDPLELGELGVGGEEWSWRLERRVP